MALLSDPFHSKEVCECQIWENAKRVHLSADALEWTCFAERIGLQNRKNAVLLLKDGSFTYFVELADIACYPLVGDDVRFLDGISMNNLDLLLKYRNRLKDI